MKQMVVATGNENKVREMREILQPLGLSMLSMKEAGIKLDIEENGTTFEENALIKARALSEKLDAIILADDSGLEIDALGKEPGVHSSRYLGEDTSYEIKNKTILERMETYQGQERSARFVCAIAAILPDGRELVVRKTMEGVIADCPAGENGFGYDPIFYVPQKGMTSAQLSPDEKNEISHRGKALRAMKEELEKALCK